MLGEVIRMNPVLTEFAENEEGFKQYMKRYEEISSDQKVRRMYAIWTEGMSALDQARAEGEKKGRAEGKEEGRAEGREEGREEANIKTARKLIKFGNTTDMISSLTELPPEKIEELRNEADNDIEE